MKNLSPIDMVLIMRRAMQAYENWGETIQDQEKASCISVPSYLGIEPDDIGCELMSRLAGFAALPSDFSLLTLRKHLGRVLGTESTLLSNPPPELDALIKLRQQPGGWRHLDGLWELVTHTSLSFACDAEDKFNARLDPDDQSPTFRFSLKAVYHRFFGMIDEYGDEVPIPTPIDNFKIGNNLTDLLSALPKIIEECVNSREEDDGHWNHFEIFDRGKRVLVAPLEFIKGYEYSLELHGSDMRAQSFIPEKIHVLQASRPLISSLLKVFGTDAVDTMMSKKFDGDFDM